MSLPPAIAHYLVTLTTQHRCPAYVHINRVGQILSVGGHIEHYDLTSAQPGEPICQHLTYLDGFFPYHGSDDTLPQLHIAPGKTADIHFVTQGHDLWLLLLDGTAEMTRQQQLQQKGNDLSLLQHAYDTMVSQAQSPATLLKTMESSLLYKIFSALNILLVEVIDSDRLRPLGELPQWLLDNFEIDPEVSQAESGTFAAESVSSFISNFIIDAETIWYEPTEAILRSGVWTETGASGQEISLEAIALSLEDRKILLVVPPELVVSEKFQWLQAAREAQLDIVNRQKEADERLFQATYYDSLTGLPNRSLFTSRLEAGRANGNTSCGICECLRQRDIPVRFGSDEFGILLSHIDSREDVLNIVERLLESINQPLLIDDQTTQLTASAGVAISESWYQYSKDLLRDANLALQQAKSLGRGRYQVFDREMRSQAFELWNLESDLRTALERNQLQLCYQPIVDLKTQRIERFEALTRWEHPTHGWIPPSKFIPLAEECGLIVALDSWALRTACTTIQQWQQSQNQFAQFNVNISAQHFSEGNLLSSIRQVVAAADIPPSALCLEITESSLLTNPDAVIHVLNQLKELGIHIAIDDFGTGYASLSYLQDLPLDMLKIDGYFVKMLGLSSTAEQVETIKQYNTLKQLECDTVQGYLLSKPLPVLDAQGLMNAEVIISK